MAPESTQRTDALEPAPNGNRRAQRHGAYVSLFTFYAGLRRGELRALRWSDIDLAAPQTRGFRFRDGGLHLGGCPGVVDSARC